jgi:hypothetical protein
MKCRIRAGKYIILEAIPNFHLDTPLLIPVHWPYANPCIYGRITSRNTAYSAVSAVRTDL